MNRSDEMIQAHNINRRTANEENVRSLIVLIDELLSVVAEENAELSKGLPASQLKQVDEKNRLADLFRQCVAECAAKTATLAVEDEILRGQFMERIQRLRDATDENVIRLRAAIEASQRRIEAVMHAIREQIATVSPYGAGGRQTTRAMSCATNLQA
jgi:hypothetical protein